MITIMQSFISSLSYHNIYFYYQNLIVNDSIQMISVHMVFLTCFFSILLQTFLINMEKSKVNFKSANKCYEQVITISQTSEYPFSPTSKNHSILENNNKKIHKIDDELKFKQSQQSGKIANNILHLSRRRHRLGERYKQQQSLHQINKNKQTTKPFSVKKVLKINELVHLFLEKLSFNSIFRSPVEYDPRESQMPISNYCQAAPNVSIYSPLIQKSISTIKIFFILSYLFIYPLGLLFKEIESSQFSIFLKFIAITLVSCDIFEISFRLSAANQKNKKNPLKKLLSSSLLQKIFQLISTIVSLILDFQGFSGGSILFITIGLSIRPYLDQIAKLERHFFSGTLNEKYWDLTKVLSMNLLVCHLLACILIAIDFIHPQDSWMSISGINTKSWYQKYIWSYYFGTTIILTIGFGDLHPGNYIEAFFIIIISFCACLFFAYNINYIGNLINIIRQDELEKNEKLKVLNSLAKRTQLSINTLEQITNHIVQTSKIKQQSKHSQQRQLIQELPYGLRSAFLAEANQKIFNHLNKLILFTNKTILNLSLKIQTKICHPNQLIKKMNEPPKLIILQSGQIGFICQRKNTSLHNLVIQRISNNMKQESKIVCVDILSLQLLKYDIKSLAYSTIHEMDKISFEACIRDSNQDYQTYREILDKSKIKLNEYGLIKCRFCDNKYHTLFQCTKVHYIPYRHILPARFRQMKNLQKQKRQSIFRNRKRNNCYEYSSYLQSENGQELIKFQGSKRQSKTLQNQKSRISFDQKWMNANVKNSESVLVAFDMVSKIREDILKLKEDNSEQYFQFNLWGNINCDEACDYKYYFSNFNPSNINTGNCKNNLQKVSRSLKTKIMRNMIKTL